MYLINLFLLLLGLPLLVNSSNQYNSNAPLQVRSADMSALAIEDCDMTCNKFKSSSTSTPQDALVILAEAGFNTVRLRVWVNPTADHNEGNLSYVVTLAKRAHAGSIFIFLTGGLIQGNKINHLLGPRLISILSHWQLQTMSQVRYAL